MDYYKNIDKLGCVNDIPLRAVGVQYDEVEGLECNPVTFNFFKEHARIDFDTDDTLCEYYLDAAVEELQSWSQLSFGVRTMQLIAKSLPKNYKLMYGRVDEVLTEGFTNTGDYLNEGGTDINITYTTKGKINTAIKIAICRYAAGLYVNRENIIDTKYNAQVGMDEAKTMLQPYRNITI